MSYSVDRHITALKSYVGFHEGSNNANPFSVWHGYGTSHLPWCDSFAQFCAVERGGFVWKSPYAQFGYKGSGYVPTTCRDAQYMGIWRDKNTRARPGWQVHFDWNGDGVQDHDETVIADDGSSLITIGGNTSNAVLYRKRDRRYVAGFVALDEAGQNGPPPPPPPPPEPTWKVPVIFLTHPQRGTWIVLEGPGGQVSFLSPTGAIVPVGMDQDPDDKREFGPRQIKKLVPRTRNDGKAGFSIVAGDDAKYVPQSQI